MPPLGLWKGLRANVSIYATLTRLITSSSGIRSILDIPCGEGSFARNLASGGYTTTAADIRSIRSVEGCTFTPANMNERLPWPDAAFDAVVCVEGIEHIERPFDFIGECYRITRPGGLLFLTTPNTSSLRSRWRYFLTGFHNKSKAPLDETDPSPWHHINLLSFSELRYLLHRTGYCLDTVTTNRIRGISWLYAPLIPVAYVVTRAVFFKEARNAAERRISTGTLKQLFSRPILFGEVTIIRAVKRRA